MYNLKNYRQYPLRDLLPFVVSHAIKSFKAMNTTFCSRLLAKWWNINLGRNCRFIGIPYFHKHPTGTIVIGESCLFRSSEWSNSIGLNRRCFISSGSDAEMVIGRQSGFSATIISASVSIRIGDYVICGANCTICDNDRHPISISKNRAQLPGESAPVVIEDNVFLGMNTVVLKGVKIGYGTVVASNSVVVSSLPERVLAGGCPARIIRNISDDERTVVPSRGRPS